MNQTSREEKMKRQAQKLTGQSLALLQRISRPSQVQQSNPFVGFCAELGFDTDPHVACQQIKDQIGLKIAKIQQLQIEAVQYTKRASKMDKRINQQNAQIEWQKAHMSELTAKVEQLTQSYQAIQIERDQAYELITKTKSEQSSQKINDQKYKALNLQFRENRRQLKNLQQKYEQLIFQNKILEQSKAQLDLIVDDLTKQLTNPTQNNSRQSQITRLENSNHVINEKEVDQLKEELIELQQKLQQLHNQRNKLADQLIVEANHASRLQEQIVSLKKELDGVRKYQSSQKIENEKYRIEKDQQIKQLRLTLAAASESKYSPKEQIPIMAVACQECLKRQQQKYEEKQQSINQKENELEISVTDKVDLKQLEEIVSHYESQKEDLLLQLTQMKKQKQLQTQKEENQAIINAQLQSQIKELRKQANSPSVQNARHLRNIEQLTTELAEAYKTINEISSKLQQEEQSKKEKKGRNRSINKLTSMLGF